MYEARQNNEKVSRRFDGGGVRQSFKKKSNNQFQITDNRKCNLNLHEIMQNKYLEIPIVQMQRRLWNIYESARRHYNDRWGRAYNIRNDTDLKNRIINENNWIYGNQQIDLGIFGSQNNRWNCYIIYNNDFYYNRNNEIVDKTRVWHCGPGTG